MNNLIAKPPICAPLNDKASFAPASKAPQAPPIDGLEQQVGAAMTVVAEGRKALHAQTEANIRNLRAPVALAAFTPDAHVALTTTGLTLAGAGAGGPDMNVTRSAALLDMPMSHTGALVGSVGTASGLVYGSVSQTLGDTTLTGYHGFVGSTHATGMAITTTLANVKLSSGVAFVGSGSASLKVEKSHENRMLLVYADEISGSLQATGGVSIGYVGFAARLGFLAKSSFEFRTWMDDEKVTALLQKTNRTQRYLSTLRLRKKLIALPYIQDPLKTTDIPNKKAPFLVGEELSLTYTGSLFGGLAVTGAGVYGGINVVLDGTRTIKIKKVSETEVVIDVIPKMRGRSVALSLDLPVLAEATAMLAKSKAMRHSYHFDLTKKEAREAYKNALSFKLPGPVAECDGWQALSGSDAQRMVAEAPMPQGVTYTLVEQAVVPYEHKRSATVTLPKLLPFANLAGYGAEQRIVHEQSVIANAHHALGNDSVSRIYETQALQKGIIETTCFGTLKTTRSPRDGLMTLDGVTLGVTFANDRTRRDSRNTLIRKINTVLFKENPLELFEGPIKTSKYNYEVTLKRHLSAEKLASLTPEGVTLADYAKKLRDQVAREGLAGLASVLAKAGEGTKPLDVTVESRAPKAILDKVLQLRALYAHKIDPGHQKPKDIETRVKRVEKYFNLLELVRSDVNRDPLLKRLAPRSKVTQDGLLRETRDSLLRLLTFENPKIDLYSNLRKKTAQRVEKILDTLSGQLSKDENKRTTVDKA